MPCVRVHLLLLRVLCGPQLRLAFTSSRNSAACEGRPHLCWWPQHLLWLLLIVQYDVLGVHVSRLSMVDTTEPASPLFCEQQLHQQWQRRQPVTKGLVGATVQDSGLP